LHEKTRVSNFYLSVLRHSVLASCNEFSHKTEKSRVVVEKEKLITCKLFVEMKAVRLQRVVYRHMLSTQAQPGVYHVTLAYRVTSLVSLNLTLKFQWSICVISRSMYEVCIARIHVWKYM